MNKFSIGSLLAGAALAGTLAVGGLVFAQGDDNGGGMMGNGGMMGMMSQMQDMMDHCESMMGQMEERGETEGMMPQEPKPEDAS